MLAVLALSSCTFYGGGGSALLRGSSSEAGMETEMSLDQYTFAIGYGIQVMDRKLEIFSDYVGIWSDYRTLQGGAIMSTEEASDSIGIGAGYNVIYRPGFRVQVFGLYGFTGLVGSVSEDQFFQGRIEAGLEVCNLKGEQFEHGLCLRTGLTRQTSDFAPVESISGLTFNLTYRFHMNGLFDQ